MDGGGLRSGRGGATGDLETFPCEYYGKHRSTLAGWRRHIARLHRVAAAEAVVPNGPQTQVFVFPLPDCWPCVLCRKTLFFTYQTLQGHLKRFHAGTAFVLVLEVRL